MLWRGRVLWRVGEAACIPCNAASSASISASWMSRSIAARAARASTRAWSHGGTSSRRCEKGGDCGEIVGRYGEITHLDLGVGTTR